MEDGHVCAHAWIALAQIIELQKRCVVVLHCYSTALRVIIWHVSSIALRGRVLVVIRIALIVSVWTESGNVLRGHVLVKS